MKPLISITVILVLNDIIGLQSAEIIQEANTRTKSNYTHEKIITSQKRKQKATSRNSFLQQVMKKRSLEVAFGTSVVRLGAAFDFTEVAGSSSPEVASMNRAASFIMAVEELNMMYSDRNLTFEYIMRDAHFTFTTAIQAAIEIDKNGFDYQGVHAYIGNDDSHSTAGADYIFQDTATPHISYAADETDLSNNDLFPGFSRVYPSTAYEGYALADLCYQQYNWQRIVVVYTLDIDGEDALAEFKGFVATHSTMSIVGIIPIDADGIVDFTAHLTALRVYDPRIFVVLVDTPDQMRGFLKSGYELGVLTSSSVVLGNSWCTAEGVESTSGEDGSFIATVFSTVTILSLQVANLDWVPTSRGQAFIKKFISQPSTIIQHPNGKTQCLNTTDDDGNFYLYKSCDETTGQCTCTGQNYSSYLANGTNIPDLYKLPYVYDSVLAMGYAIANYSIQGDGSYSVTEDLIDVDLKTVLVNNVSFEGITGHVAFSPGRPCKTMFGRGDRTAGVRFAVMNMQSTTLSADSVLTDKIYNLRRVGTWSTELGFVSCEGDSIVNNASEVFTGGCYGPTRFGGGGSSNFAAPSDRPPHLLVPMSSSMRDALLAIGVIQIICVLALASVLLWYRKTRLVKASQPALMWLVLLACILGSARIGLFQAPISDGVCIAGLWVGHVSFALGVAALFVKTLRVHLIVNAKNFKQVKFSTGKALKLNMLIVFVTCVYLLVVCGISTPHMDTISTTTITGQVVSYHSCVVPVQFLDTILYVFEALLLALTTKLCYDTKDVPDAVNEAKPIVIAISIIVVVCVIGFTMAVVVPMEVDVLNFALGVCFYIACTLALLAYFGPKAYLLLTGADLNRQFKIVRKGSGGGNRRKPGAVVAGAEGEGEHDHSDTNHYDTALAIDEEEGRRQKSIVALYLTEMPQSQQHCRILISQLQRMLMTMNMESAPGNSSNNPSGHHTMLSQHQPQQVSVVEIINHPVHTLERDASVSIIHRSDTNPNPEDSSVLFVKFESSPQGHNHSNKYSHTSSTDHSLTPPHGL